MFEETSQTDVINENVDFIDDGSDLFVDDASEETSQSEEFASEETTENTGNEESGEESAASAQPETFTVTHFGNEVNLTMDELRTNAQKGLDYDRIKEERDKFKNSHKLMESYAKMFGVSTEEYINKVSEEFKNAEAKQYAEQNGVTEDGAKQILSLQRELETYKNKENQTNKREEMRQAFSRFAANHPDVDIKTLPDEVFKNYIEKGIDFEASYAIYENQRLKSEIAALKQNKQNEETAVGSAKDEGGSNAADPFLEGFNG